jgi:hypothetical protein
VPARLSHRHVQDRPAARRRRDALRHQGRILPCCDGSWSCAAPSDGASDVDLRRAWQPEPDRPRRGRPREDERQNPLRVSRPAPRCRVHLGVMPTGWPRRCPCWHATIKKSRSGTTSTPPGRRPCSARSVIGSHPARGWHRCRRSAFARRAARGSALCRPPSRSAPNCHRRRVERQTGG